MIPASHGCGAASARKSAVIINGRGRDRKSTRLNSSHSQISYAVFCLKKKKYSHDRLSTPQPTIAYETHVHATLRLARMHGGFSRYTISSGEPTGLWLTSCLTARGIYR